ncbi:unnamed protein product [Phaedon cochleariae]|uniref:Uncharacterized protein n=1 Tax=Phaedon cochleariae TaxID=80249 RepID=A0A9N9X436_PHACE|nr:unnamed protein product [Phaedon cochleariae]
MYEIATCNFPKNLKQRSRTLTTIKGYNKTDENNELLNSSTLEDLMWILASTVEEVFADESTMPARLEPGSTWAAYNSLIIEVKPKNSVQVTAMQNLERINKYLQGNDKKLIVTLDLGLYRPVLQLQMALSQRNWFLVPGDLHIQMAQLGAIGNYIELTGIPEAWVESGLYSETTVKHILDGKPGRRSLKAHIVTVTSLSILLLESFFEKNHYLKEGCSAIAIEMRNIWKTKDRCDITTQSHSMRERLKDLDFPLKLENFFKEKSELSPTFKMVKNYMHMVFSMLAFARSTRNANWNLRIAALDDFTKYFFALDLRNYAFLCAWYISEVRSLEILDHETLTQLKSGNWYPNKSNNPFCCLGVDEALEQENRRLKVLGGIVGITRRQQTLTKYFLASPEIAKLTRQADVVSSSSNKAMHHEVNNAISTRQNRNVIALLQCLSSYTNPFQ